MMNLVLSCECGTVTQFISRCRKVAKLVNADFDSYISEKELNPSKKKEKIYIAKQESLEEWVKFTYNFETKRGSFMLHSRLL